MENKDMICKKCGYHYSNTDVLCPFCEDDLILQEKLKEKFLITPKLNELFEEEKLNIKFNTRSIINDIDASQDPEYEAITLKAASKSAQYLQSDVTPTNLTRIDENLSYYNEELNKYKNKQKKELETFGIGALQRLVAEFNDVVNMCNKYDKMIDNKAIKLRIKNTIEAYNKEIHYVKKYFILPLYDSTDLLNGSRMAKTFINIISLMIGYFVLAKLPFMQSLESFICGIFTHPTSGSEILKQGNIESLIAVCFAVWLTNIVFTFYIDMTIKNKNFKVDQGKSYEIILTFAIIGWAVASYHQTIAIFYNIIIMMYIAYFGIINIVTKKRGLNWFFVRIASVIFVVCLLINLFLFMV